MSFLSTLRPDNFSRWKIVIGKNPGQTRKKFD